MTKRDENFVDPCYRYLGSQTKGPTRATPLPPVVRKELPASNPVYTPYRLDKTQPLTQVETNKLQYPFIGSGMGDPFPDKPSEDRIFSGRTRPSRPVRRPATRNASISRPKPCCSGDALEQQIEGEIVVNAPNVRFEDIAGLSVPKRLLQESVALPLIIPEYFTGIREPWRGVLLFGPPGTGKTMLARAVAADTRSVFFNVSAASLVSKWHGESERLMATLFRMARARAPSVIFFDEVDVLGGQRGGHNEHEASRRLKGQLLSCMDGLLSEENANILVLATTNRPWDLDDALRRRFEKRIYVPLPEAEVRKNMFWQNLSSSGVMLASDLSPYFLDQCAEQTEGYSGADVRVICREAAMGPIRRVLASLPSDQLVPTRECLLSRLRNSKTGCQDVLNAIKNTRPSVRSSDLERFEGWMAEFGAK
jgi:katanin p60 ATPase-containing subunit A1